MAEASPGGEQDLRKTVAAVLRPTSGPGHDIKPLTVIRKISSHRLRWTRLQKLPKATRPNLACQRNLHCYSRRPFPL